MVYQLYCTDPTTFVWNTVPFYYIGTYHQRMNLVSEATVNARSGESQYFSDLNPLQPFPLYIVYIYIYVCNVLQDALGEACALLTLNR